jgi:hypothetical protein
MWLSADVPEEWYLPLWKLLGSHAWPQLRSVCLGGLLVCETGLTDLLMRQCSLLNLQFCNIVLYHGSLKAFFLGSDPCCLCKFFKYVVSSLPSVYQTKIGFSLPF